MINLFCSFAGRSAHRISSLISLCFRRYCHKRCGKVNGLVLMIFFAAVSNRMLCNFSLAVFSLYSLAQFTLMVKCQLLLDNSLAPQADNFKIAGPLIPQCVISSGPCDDNFVPLIFTVALSATTPISSVMLLPGILKVNKEGTGSSIV